MNAKDTQHAARSLDEERQAISTYTGRLGSAQDPQLRSSLTHARKDEREHARLFRRTLRRGR